MRVSRETFDEESIFRIGTAECKNCDHTAGVTPPDLSARMSQANEELGNYEMSCGKDSTNVFLAEKLQVVEIDRFATQ